MNWRGLIVDIIRRLWDKGLYRDNKTLQAVHKNWFNFWVDHRTSITLKDVDKRTKKLNDQPIDIAKPVYWEEETGETALGGPIGYRYEFKDD